MLLRLRREIAGEPKTILPDQLFFAPLLLAVAFLSVVALLPVLLPAGSAFFAVFPPPLPLLADFDALAAFIVAGRASTAGSLPMMLRKRIAWRIRW